MPQSARRFAVRETSSDGMLDRMDLARVTSIESLAISRQSFHFYLGPKIPFR